MKTIRFLIGATVLAVSLGASFAMAVADDLNKVPVSAPIDADSAGRGGETAVQSVLRIICAEQNSAGTGFLHKSGDIITAAHVVHDCAKPLIILPNGTRINATVIAADEDYDLAILKPESKISATPLPISLGNNFTVGTQVSTWGFPGGYFGLTPLLSVGYLAGLDAQQKSGKIVKQWIVNAAFNGGNSGGPLIHIETGAVMGLVSSKLAPITQDTATILGLLEKQQSGFTYTGTKPDGTNVTFTEGQLIGMVLKDLRSQMQLVIGKAVLLGDLTAFLKANKIDP